MDVSIVSALKAKRQAYISSITETNGKIANCEKAYESLRLFKESVTRSQEDFHTVNSNKSKVLQDVAGVQKNCDVAARYYKGMDSILNGIGSKIIGVVYTVLLNNISSKLKKYTNSVSDYENDIARYEKKIRDLDRQIEEAQKAEEMAAQLLGGE